MLFESKFVATEVFCIFPNSCFLVLRNGGKCKSKEITKLGDGTFISVKCRGSAREL